MGFNLLILFMTLCVFRSSTGFSMLSDKISGLVQCHITILELFGSIYQVLFQINCIFNCSYGGLVGWYGGLVVSVTRSGFESRSGASPQGGLKGGRSLCAYCTNKVYKKKTRSRLAVREENYKFQQGTNLVIFFFTAIVEREKGCWYTL